MAIPSVRQHYHSRVNTNATNDNFGRGVDRSNQSSSGQINKAIGSIAKKLDKLRSNLKFIGTASAKLGKLNFFNKRPHVQASPSRPSYAQATPQRPSDAQPRPSYAQATPQRPSYAQATPQRPSYTHANTQRPYASTSSAHSSHEANSATSNANSEGNKFQAQLDKTVATVFHLADSYPGADTSGVETLIESAALLSLAERPEEVAFAKSQFKEVLNNTFDQLSRSMNPMHPVHADKLSNLKLEMLESFEVKAGENTPSPNAPGARPSSSRPSYTQANPQRPDSSTSSAHSSQGTTGATPNTNSESNKFQTQLDKTVATVFHLADSYPGADTSGVESLMESAALLSLAERPEEIAFIKNQFTAVLNDTFDQLSRSMDPMHPVHADKLSNLKREMLESLETKTGENASSSNTQGARPNASAHNTGNSQEVNDFKPTIDLTNDSQYTKASDKDKLKSIEAAFTQTVNIHNKVKGADFRSSNGFKNAIAALSEASNNNGVIDQGTKDELATALKKEYYKLSRSVHPDRIDLPEHMAEATENFQQFTAAYKRLSDLLDNRT